MSAARPKARSYHPDRLRDALLAQVEFVRLAARELTGEQLTLPSGLPGWDVRTLLAHLAQQIDALPRLLAEPAPATDRPEVGLEQWMAATAGIAGLQDERARTEAVLGRDQAAAIDAAAEELEAVVETGVRADLLLPHRFGVMRAQDFTLTRIVELVVHSDDLTRATGRQVRLDRQALAIAVRLLADALAERAPGGSTELRVPPFAAVQCLAGPRHTRGTPGNIVEADPVTWLRLATGRVTWQTVLPTGRLRASGARAGELRHQLPVLS